MQSAPDACCPASSLPSSTGTTLLEISAQAGMSGSDPMAFSIVHFTASKCRVVPGPTLAFSRTRGRSEEHTSELQSIMRISYAVFCLKKTKINLSHKECSTLNRVLTHKTYQLDFPTHIIIYYNNTTL